MSGNSWDSYKVLMDIKKRMNELVQQSLAQIDRVSDFRSGSTVWKPPFDVLETEEEYIIYGELPGVDKKDLNISLIGSELTVRGERRPDVADKPLSYHQAERVYGSFERTFNLPDQIAEDRITTSLKDGMLEVSIKKQSPRTIPIQ